MKTRFTYFILLSSIVMNAQTKLIAYKSHSGNLNRLSENIFKNSFDINESNFGIGPELLVKNASLDTVIFIDDSKSVIITSNRCENRRNKRTSKWNPGKDTLVNSPFFNNKDINQLKETLKKEFYFENDMDSVVFLKYNVKKKTYKNITPKVSKKEIKKTEKTRNKKISFLGLILVSGTIGYFGIRKKK